MSFRRKRNLAAKTASPVYGIDALMRTQKTGQHESIEISLAPSRQRHRRRMSPGQKMVHFDCHHWIPFKNSALEKRRWKAGLRKLNQRGMRQFQYAPAGSDTCDPFRSRSFVRQIIASWPHLEASFRCAQSPRCWVPFPVNIRPSCDAFW